MPKFPFAQYARQLANDAQRDRFARFVIRSEQFDADRLIKAFSAR